MKYPMLNNWLEFKRINKDTYEVSDCLAGYGYEMGIDLLRFARKLDGKRNPYKISRRYSKSDVNEMLEILDDAGLLRHSRILEKEFGSIYYSLCFPHITKEKRIISFFLNILLSLSFIPLLISGVIVFSNNIYDINTDYMIIGSIIGLIVGVLLHELGHALATVGCGGKLYEIGIMVKSFLPGAYVLSDVENVKSKFFRMQMHAAGIEVNFSLVGISLLLSTLNYELCGLFLGIAFNNLLLGLLNLTFVNGLDGSHLLCEIFENDEIVDEARKIIFNKRIRKRMRKKGVNGEAYVAVCYIIGFFQLVLPLVYLWNIGEIISCFT